MRDNSHVSKKILLLIFSLFGIILVYFVTKFQNQKSATNEDDEGRDFLR